MTSKSLPVLVALSSGHIFQSDADMDITNMENMILKNRSLLNAIGETKRRSTRDTLAVWEATTSLGAVELDREELDDGTVEILWPSHAFYFIYVTQKGACEPSVHAGKGEVNKIGTQIPTKEFWANGSPRPVKIGFEQGGDATPKIRLRIKGTSKSIRLAR